MENITINIGTSVKRTPFTLEDALKYQQNELIKWSKLLKEDVYNRLCLEVAKRNLTNTSKNPYNVFRGQDITNLVSNMGE